MDMKNIEICEEIKKRLEEKHIKRIAGFEKPILLISSEYPGLWLEHVYDSVFYATLDKEKLYLAESATEIFMKYQKPNGQLPYVAKDTAEPSNQGSATVGYWQIQECVSFASLCLLVYDMNRNKDYLKKAYTSVKKWVGWLRDNRMTRGLGLVEMFVGFDTGHDNSGRLEGMSYPTAYIEDGVRREADKIPPCEVAPIIAVDMNCNFYGNLKAIAKMARILGSGEEEIYEEKADRKSVV